MATRILVTGGAGFIGSHLVDALIRRGFEVTVLDRITDENRANVPEEVDILDVDLTKPAALELVRQLAPDIIFHFAANSSVQQSVAEPLRDLKINYLATLRLLHAASRLGVQRFVFASTGGALSSEDTRLPTPEDHPSEPRSPYAKHKLMSEQAGEHFARSSGLPFVALRFGNVYGPRQTPTVGEGNVISTLAHRMVRGEPIRINGTGMQTRDYVYVDDAIRACLMVLDQPSASGPFNVGSGEETDVLTLYRHLAESAGYGKQPVFAQAQASEPLRSRLDISRIRAVLGWEPLVPLREGLLRTLDWHEREHRQAVKPEA